MNGLNLDEIAVLLERHGITCVVRNEMERKPCGVFRRLPLPNRNNEQNTKLKRMMANMKYSSTAVNSKCNFKRMINK